MRRSWTLADTGVAAVYGFMFAVLSFLAYNIVPIGHPTVFGTWLAPVVGGIVGGACGVLVIRTKR